MISIAPLIGSLSMAFADTMTEEVLRREEPLGPFVNPLDPSRITSLAASRGLSITELGDDRKHRDAAKMQEAWHYTNNGLVIKTFVGARRLLPMATPHNFFLQYSLQGVL